MNGYAVTVAKSGAFCPLGKSPNFLKNGCAACLIGCKFSVFFSDKKEQFKLMVLLCLKV